MIVMRIEDKGRRRERQGAAAVHVVDEMLEQLGLDQQHNLFGRWCGLPTPDLDAAPAGLRIRFTERHSCGCSSIEQLLRWWPAWAISALAHPSAEHGVVLQVYETSGADAQVLETQTLFELANSRLLTTVALAKSGVDAAFIGELFTFYQRSEAEVYHVAAAA